MLPEECTALFILLFTLFMMWQAMNLPDDAEFEQGAKIEL